MRYLGYKLKELLEKNAISTQEIADDLKIKNEIVESWLINQVPKAKYFVYLCCTFNVIPEYFFEDDSGKYIKMPVHYRKQVIQGDLMNKTVAEFIEMKIKELWQEETLRRLIREEIEKLFRNQQVIPYDVRKTTASNSWD